jgi:hypothetical protein
MTIFTLLLVVFVISSIMICANVNTVYAQTVEEQLQQAETPIEDMLSNDSVVTQSCGGSMNTLCLEVTYESPSLVMLDVWYIYDGQHNKAGARAIDLLQTQEFGYTLEDIEMIETESSGYKYMVVMSKK